MSNFIDHRWDRTVTRLLRADQRWVLNAAGNGLLASGRIEEAVVPLQIAAEASAVNHHWQNAARGFGNLAEAQIQRGDLSPAIENAERAVHYADLAGYDLEAYGSRAKLAYALLQYGNLEDSERIADEALGLAIPADKDHIRSAGVFYYLCEVLKDSGRMTEAKTIASHMLEVHERDSQLPQLGLDLLSLGRVEEAVMILRQAGILPHLCRSLLDRGTSDDLETVRRWAANCGMRLHLADYYIQATRLNLREQDADGAIEALKEAAALVASTHYFRRQRLIEELGERIRLQLTLCS